MKTGITIGLGARAENTIEGLVARGRDLEAQGFHSLWMANAFGFDAITALAVVASATTSIEIGTAVVPTYPRHPVVMAQQALTAQDAARGRFTLGIGLSHKVMIEDALGIPFTHPARHMRAYLAVLAPLLQGEAASFRGEEYRVEAALTIGTAPVPLLVAALGPVMLKLTGAHADGTITSWVGPRALESHVVPTITAAADAAQRPRPRVVVGLPIALTDDADAAREQLARQVALYNSLPSYRAMLDHEGVGGPADIAILGDEKTLDAELARLEDAGATEFAAQVVSVGPGSTARTITYLANRL
jgi:F420-dependent oxidoreductase-like protein